VSNAVWRDWAELQFFRGLAPRKHTAQSLTKALLYFINVALIELDFNCYLRLTDSATGDSALVFECVHWRLCSAHITDFFCYISLYLLLKQRISFSYAVCALLKNFPGRFLESFFTSYRVANLLHVYTFFRCRLLTVFYNGEKSRRLYRTIQNKFYIEQLLY